ncbi:MAG: zinc ribbon domain-containing protein [Bacteroidetes bacterium]|nr:zinc ribbon domain-containing protein [Bacteroidota bacterium]
MPTYDYKRADGTVFEASQSITAEPFTECPTTGQPVKRVISGGTGFILKGTGFYQTDYAAKPVAEKPKDSKTEDQEPKGATNGKLADEKKSVPSKSED